MGEKIFRQIGQHRKCAQRALHRFGDMLIEREGQAPQTATLEEAPYRGYRAAGCMGGARRCRRRSPAPENANRPAGCIVYTGGGCDAHVGVMRSAGYASASRGRHVVMPALPMSPQRGPASAGSFGRRPIAPPARLHGHSAVADRPPPRAAWLRTAGAPHAWLPASG